MTVIIVVAASPVSNPSLKIYFGVTIRASYSSGLEKIILPVVKWIVN